VRQLRGLVVDDDLRDRRVVDEDTAARMCGTSPRSWRRMRLLGETPPMIRISPRRIGYYIKDLEEWIESRRVSSIYGARRAS